MILIACLLTLSLAITSEAQRRNPEAGKKKAAKRIGKVATIGTPYQGSVEAIAKICMGTSTLGADGSSSREREAARMTPSLYYLLPSFKGAVEKDAVNLFDAGSWQLGVLETLKRYLNTYSVKFEGNASIVQARALLTEMLEPAEAHRKRIEAVGGVPGDLGADNWLAIAGIGAETRTSVGAGKTPEGNPFFDFPEPKKDGGDNTVPLAGAKPTFLDSKQLVAVSRSDFTFGEIGNRLLSSGIGLHASLPAMNLVQRLVVSMFQGDLEGNPGGRPMPSVTREPPKLEARSQPTLATAIGERANAIATPVWSSMRLVAAPATAIAPADMLHWRAAWSYCPGDGSAIRKDWIRSKASARPDSLYSASSSWSQRSSPRAPASSSMARSTTPTPTPATRTPAPRPSPRPIPMRRR